MNSSIEELRNELKNHADDQVKESSKRFFKEPIESYGIKASVVKEISKIFFKKIEGLPKEEIFHLCEPLWQSGILEESFVACYWSYFIRKWYEPEDFKTFERWINRYVTNWASCDSLCTQTTGMFLEKFPQEVNKVKPWAFSANRWMRRASAVSLIAGVRKGKFIQEVFQIADILLHDPEDMVQKGYGWMLKTTCKHYQQEVFEYVMRNKNTMPRTALRYAIEKMPKELRKQAMIKEK
ncbi:MAG: DNA alkylation repair protein [Bacteroidales bacterium]|jgi:3-methyladenine DNA glycosylase AlkD|nr:DNA alkylation repair protein [Bacteroidales bacterium]